MKPDVNTIEKLIDNSNILKNWEVIYYNTLPAIIRIINNYIVDKIIDFEKINIEKILESKIFNNVKKIKTQEYLKEGTYPIIDQGKTFIGGYTNDNSLIIEENLPLIIFGDHTRNIKFIQEPFAVGADGVKLLKPKKYFSEKFFYYQLFSLNFDDMGYSRYYKQLKVKELIVPYPDDRSKSLDFQNDIVEFLDNLLLKIIKLNNNHYNLKNSILSLLTSIKINYTLNNKISDSQLLIPQLRKAILQSAIQGKLVPQSPNNEPASELLKRIKAEKEKLVKEGKIKREKQLLPVREDEIPFEIPKNWVWCRLIEVSSIFMGQSPDGTSYNIKGIGIPLINGPVEFGKGHFDSTIKSKWTTAPTQMCIKGDLIICVRGSTTGRTNISGFDACIGRGVAAIRPLISEKYLHYFILHYRNNIFNLGTGTTFPSISKEDLHNLLIPLPTANEQHRIVKKVDKLMKFCDELETKIKSSKADTDKLMQAVLEEAFGNGK